MRRRKNRRERVLCEEEVRDGDLYDVSGGCCE
jgi:hypothetical protein